MRSWVWAFILAALALAGIAAAQPISPELEVDWQEDSIVPGSDASLVGSMELRMQLGGLPLLVEDPPELECMAAISIASAELYGVPTTSECLAVASGNQLAAQIPFALQVYGALHLEPTQLAAHLEVEVTITGMAVVQHSVPVVLRVLPVAAWSLAYDAEAVPVVINQGNIPLRLGYSGVEILVPLDGMLSLSETNLDLAESQSIRFDLLENPPGSIIREPEPLAYAPPTVRPSLLPAFVAVGGLLVALAVIAHKQARK